MPCTTMQMSSFSDNIALLWVKLWPLYLVLSLLVSIGPSDALQIPDAKISSPDEDSFGAELWAFAQDEDEFSPKKRAERRPGVIFTSLTAPTVNGSITFNISLPTSGCNRVMANSSVGEYMFVNGTTKRNATMRDILDDFWFVKRNAASPHIGMQLLVNHSILIGAQVANESQHLLDSGLICKGNGSQTDEVEISDEGDINANKENEDSEGIAVVHNELRHLLWTWKGKLAEIVVIGLLSGIGGFVAALKSWLGLKEEDVPFVKTINGSSTDIPNSAVYPRKQAQTAGFSAFFVTFFTTYLATYQEWITGGLLKGVEFVMLFVIVLIGKQFNRLLEGVTPCVTSLLARQQFGHMFNPRAYATYPEIGGGEGGGLELQPVGPERC